MALPLTVYGATHCEDTQHVREQLTAWFIPFAEVNIDHDAVAEQFVIFINGGQRRTPTLVIGSSDRKTILTEPGDDLLKATLLDSGYVPGYPQNHSVIDDATFLKNILFDIRGCLTTLSGIAMLARDSTVNPPVTMTNWLKKWRPAIETWQQTQDTIRLQNSLSRNTSNGEALIAELIAGLEYVPESAAEARTLSIPQSLLEKELVELALHTIERLNLIYRLLISQEYKQIYR